MYMRETKKFAHIKVFERKLPAHTKKLYAQKNFQNRNFLIKIYSCAYKLYAQPKNFYVKFFTKKISCAYKNLYAQEKNFKLKFITILFWLRNMRKLKKILRKILIKIYSCAYKLYAQIKNLYIKFPTKKISCAYKNLVCAKKKF